MRLLPLVLLLACDIEPGAAPAAYLPPPPVLSVGALMEGEPLTLSVAGLTPGTTAHFFFSRNEGPGPCHPTIPTLCLDLVAPTRITTATAGPDGVATRTLTVPDPLGVARASFQAVALRGGSGMTTDVVSRVRGDGDLDGFEDPSLPTIGSVTVLGGTACEPFVCAANDVVDPEGDPVSIRYAWYVDDALVPFSDTPELPAGAVIGVGERVRCEASATDGSMVGGAPAYSDPVSSNLITAVDRPPVVLEVRASGHLRPGEAARCAWRAEDDCADPLQVTTTWRVDGVPVATGDVVQTAGLPPGADVQCEVAVADGLNPPTVATSAPSPIGQPRWRIEAELPGGRAGYAVEVLGDLDGDGLAEVAVGAPDTSTATATQAGAVYVPSGRDDVAASNLADVAAGAGGFVVSGTSGSYDVATMGCTPYLVTACPTIQAVGGLEGEDTGPAGAGFGAALAWSGDADGDGVGDLVAAAPYELVGNLWRGRTYVLSGARLEADPMAGAVFDGAGFTFDGECGRRRDLDQAMRTLPAPYRATNGDLTGSRAASIGDANGDGLGDFAVSSPNHGNNDEGTVYLVYGRDDGAAVGAASIYTRDCDGSEISTTGVEDGVGGVAAFGPNVSNNASAPAQWGRLLAPAGDFDGDGFDDVLVPSSGFGATNSTHILRGGPSRRSLRIAHPSADPATMWSVLLGNFSFNGANVTGRWELGFPAGGGGDVNGDGLDDLAFLGRDFNRDTWLSVLFGRSAEADGALNTEEAFDGSGRGLSVRGSIDLSTDRGRVQVIGDFNGDGYDDVAGSAPAELTSRGRVYLAYGAPQTQPGVSVATMLTGQGGMVFAGDQDHEQLGWELAGGDVDGDGLDDLVMGAPGWDSAAGWDAGRVIVEFGRDTAGVITHRGGPGFDVLEGSEAADVMVGGRLHDLLFGRGGADVLYGGDGDDLIEIGDPSFRRVRGGRGEDTLIVGGGISALDLRAAGGRISGMERIDLFGQALTVATIDVMRASDTSNRMVVGGFDGQVVTRAGDGWRLWGEAQDRGRNYLVLVDGRAELWIDAGLETVIPPTVPDAPWVVAENPGPGAVIGAVAAVDPDGDDDAIVYAIVSDPSGALAIDADTGEVRVTNPSWFDFEAARPPWPVGVRATDAEGLVTTAEIMFSTADLNEAPVFLGGDPVWSVEEGTVDTLGRVTAVDVDAGDLLTFAIIDDPSGLFDVDPITGDLELLPGATLDHETAAEHWITVEATDLAGLTDVIVIELRVGDIDVLERDLRVAFDLRGWSIHEDGRAQDSAGLEIFGLTQSGATQYCYTVPAADALHTENFSTRWNNGWQSAPMSFEAEYSGTICGSTSVVYDQGSWNATVPFDVQLVLPDEITPGATFTIQSTATPRADGAALWGTSPGLEFEFGIELRDVDVYLAGCDSLFTHSCAVAVDRRSIYRTFRDGWSSPSTTWTGGLLDDPNRFVLTVAEPIVVDSVDLQIDWDDYWQNIATAMGLPSNEGSFQYEVGGAGANTGMFATFDYTIFASDVVYRSESASVVSLDVRGIDAVIAFENGSISTFRLGEPATITAPRNGDRDGDGDVDVSIDLRLDAVFENTFAHAERAGYAVSGGFGSVRVTSIAGDLLANKGFGPAYEYLCAPRIGGEQIPITCFTSGDTEVFSYEPGGFNSPAILGALDLAGP